MPTVTRDRAPLRVCMVTGYRPTPGGGGMEKHVYELVGGLLERGVDVEIICEDRSFLPNDTDDLGVRVLGVPSSSFESLDWIELYRRKSAAFAAVLQPERYDVVHCHSHYGRDVAVKVSHLSRRPALVTTYHLTPEGQLERFRQLGIPEPEGAPIDHAVGRMEAKAAQLSDRCIAVSHGVGREIAHFYEIPPGRISLVHNWYDSRKFQARDRFEARRTLGLELDGTYLLYIGHFELHRGELLADVMRQLPPDITLLTIHPTPDESMKDEFGDRIEFAGYVAPDRLALYYAAADLQCFPTVYSGFGLVLIEGMACGCPPVVFNFSAMNEIVTDECGYLVDEASADAYASMILHGLADRGQKQQAAVRRAQEFERDRQIDRVLGIYEETVSVSNQPAPGRSDGQAIRRVESPIHAPGRST